MFFFELWCHKKLHHISLNEFYFKWMGRKSTHFFDKTVLSYTDSRYNCMNYEKRIPWRKQLDPKNYILIGIYVLF